MRLFWLLELTNCKKAGIRHLQKKKKKMECGFEFLVLKETQEKEELQSYRGSWDNTA